MKKILVVCPSWVGDVVMATPALQNLRKSNCHITLLLKPYLKKVVSDSDYYDEVILWDKKKFWKTVFEIKKRKFDIGIIFPNSFRSALIVFFANIKERIGYSRSCRSLLLTKKIKPLKKGKKFIASPMIDYYNNLLNCINTSIHTKEMKLNFSEKLEKEAIDYLKKYKINTKNYIAINPCANYGSSKCWGADNFSKLINLISENLKIKSIILCGPSEIKLVEDIMNNISNKSYVVDTSKEIIPLDLLKPIIYKSLALITNDTGPRHYGIALKIPTITLMGPTDPEWTRNNFDKEIILFGKSDCMPCMKRKCSNSFHCLSKITPEKVLSEIKKIIEK